jgi:signal transduction histidine kinase
LSLVEGERKLLAADLHDQTLADLRELAQLARRLANNESSAEELRQGLLQLIAGLDSSMDEVRRVMERLSPSSLDTLGLLPAIEDCLLRASNTCDPPIATRFSCLVVEEQITLSEIEQMLLYRIIQEALNNISKHAGASSVELLVAQLAGDLFVRITDDGCGFRSTDNLRVARGLVNMRYRAELIGARLTWLRASADRGTAVEIRVPMR